MAAKSADATALVDELESLVDDVLDQFPQLRSNRSVRRWCPRSRRSSCSTACSASERRPTVLNFLKVLSRHGRLASAAADRRGIAEEAGRRAHAA